MIFKCLLISTITVAAPSAQNIETSSDHLSRIASPITLPLLFFQDRNQQSRIEADFAMCISLYHAYELLLQHGILSFFNFIKSIMDGTKGMPRAKTEITKNYEFSQLMDELREEIEPPMESNANESLLFSQFSPRRRALMNVPKPSATFKSHPKLMKLKEIVLEHFQTFKDKSGADSKGVTTRVMIFSQYRDSVNEIAALLAQHKPLVRVMSFIGQQSTGKSSRGLSQKEQLQVWLASVNPLSPNIHIQILQTDFHTFF